MIKYLLIIFLIQIGIIYGLDANYKCVVPKYVSGCQYQFGGLQCPTLTDCVQYIVNNFKVDTTDCIKVLYEQGVFYGSTHCGANINIPTSLYIGTGGAAPATINCNNENKYITINTSFTPYNPWLNISINSLTITNTMYKRIDQNSDGGGIQIAGFQTATLQTTKLNMTNSYTTGNGGFISSIFPIILISSTFTTGTSIGQGGAIYSEQSVISHSSSYSNCEAQGSGGAIFAETVNFMTSTAIGNYAQYDGGAVSCTQCYMFFSVVNQNSAGNIGGAVFSMSGQIQFGSVLFSQNYAATCGGALHLINATGSVTTSNFTDNKSLYGGALCLVDLPVSGAIDFLDSVFSNNVAVEQGGALHITSTRSPNVIYHGIFFNNTNPTLSCDEASQYLCNSNCTISSCGGCGVSPCLEDYDRNFSACFDSTCKNEYQLDPFNYETYSKVFFNNIYEQESNIKIQKRK